MILLSDWWCDVDSWLRFIVPVFVNLAKIKFPKETGWSSLNARSDSIVFGVQGLSA